MKRYFTKLGADFSTMNSLGVPVQVVMEPDFLGYMQTATPELPNVDICSQHRRSHAEHRQHRRHLRRGTAQRRCWTSLRQHRRRTGPSHQLLHRHQNAEPPHRLEDQHLERRRPAELVTGPAAHDRFHDPTPGRGNGHARPDLGRGAHLHRQSSRRARWIPQESRRDIVGGVRRPDAVPSHRQVRGSTAPTPSTRASWAPNREPRRSATSTPSSRAPTKPGGHIRCRHPEVLRPVKIRVRSLLHEVQRAFPAHSPMCRQCSPPCRTPPSRSKYGLVVLQRRSVEQLPAAGQFTVASPGRHQGDAQQILQGHINGSTTLPGTDLSNTVANFEDSATSYFFGDSFTATDGRLDHFSENQGRPRISVSETPSTGVSTRPPPSKRGDVSPVRRGLGISTREHPPGGPINDQDFWMDKAASYLASVQSG